MAQPDRSWPIQRFLDQLASAEPTPGGGSAAALAGCLGCALGSMISRILLSRSKLRPAEIKCLKDGVRELERSREKLSKLIRADAEAYRRLLAAQRGGGAALQSARRAAVRCPLEICRETVAAMQILQCLLKKTGPYLGSDVQAGLSLLKGAFSSSLEMAVINLRGGALGAEGKKVQTELDRLERQAGRRNGRRS